MTTSPPSAPDERVTYQRLPMAALGARILDRQWRRAAAHEAGARSGEDPEDVHKMRVATRRLRAALRPFGKYLDEALGEGYSEALVDDLRLLAGALGAVRDLDVQVETIQGRAADAPEDAAALDRLAALRMEKRAAARAGLVDVLDGPLMPRLRACIQRAALVEWPMGGRPSKQPQVRGCVPRILQKDLRRLHRVGDGLTAPSAEELHRIRIDAKRLRYDGEFLAPAFGDALDPLIVLATDIQSALGIVHDADVAEVTLLEDIQRAASDPERSADCGALARLLSWYQYCRAEARKDFQDSWADLPKPNSIRKTLQEWENRAERASDSRADSVGEEEGHDERLP
jgi:CHAD domain-containing protein